MNGYGFPDEVERRRAAQAPDSMSNYPIMSRRTQMSRGCATGNLKSPADCRVDRDWWCYLAVPVTRRTPSRRVDSDSESGWGPDTASGCVSATAFNLKFTSATGDSWLGSADFREVSPPRPKYSVYSGLTPFNCLLNCSVSKMRLKFPYRKLLIKSCKNPYRKEFNRCRLIVISFRSKCLYCSK